MLDGPTCRPYSRRACLGLEARPVFHHDMAREDSVLLWTVSCLARVALAGPCRVVPAHVSSFDGDTKLSSRAATTSGKSGGWGRADSHCSSVVKMLHLPRKEHLVLPSLVCEGLQLLHDDLHFLHN